jgi:dolichol-phosphate mannosyltransferase
MGERVAYSIIIPAYLEEENLRVLLPRLTAVAANLPGPAEIVIVETAEPLDNTAAVCREYGVRCVNRRSTNSFGDAVRTGIAEARGEWTIFMDADGSHAPEFIPQLLAETPHNDVVIASRYVRGGNTDNSALLVLMSRVLNWTYSIVLNIDCADVSNSFKVYRSDLLKRLNLRCDNFDVVEEILLRVLRQNANVKVKEIPFTFRSRMFGRTKRNLLLFMFTYLYTIIRLRFFSTFERRDDRGGTP